MAANRNTGISTVRCGLSLIRRIGRGSPSWWLAIALLAGVAPVATAGGFGGFLNGLGGATQGAMKNQCMESCAPGDGQCYQACANAYGSPQSGYAPSARPIAGDTMMGTLVNSRWGTNVRGMSAYECTYEVFGRRTTVIVEDVCPPSMDFK